MIPSAVPLCLKAEVTFNADKCHLLISGSKNEYMWPKLDEDIVWESKQPPEVFCKKRCS